MEDVRERIEIFNGVGIQRKLEEGWEIMGIQSIDGRNDIGKEKECLFI